MIRWVLPLFAIAAAVQTPNYIGLVPPKPDIPFLKHANHLVETEAVEVKEEKSKDDILYTVAGDASPAQTPLSLPIFLLQAEKLDPLKLQLYRLRAVDGHREIRASEEKHADVIHVTVSRLAAGLFRLDVADDLATGQYMLSVTGANQAFCFAID